MYEDLTKNKLHNLIPQHISLFACLNQFKDGLVLWQINQVLQKGSDISPPTASLFLTQRYFRINTMKKIFQLNFSIKYFYV